CRCGFGISFAFALQLDRVTVLQPLLAPHDDQGVGGQVYFEAAARLCARYRHEAAHAGLDPEDTAQLVATHLQIRRQSRTRGNEAQAATAARGLGPVDESE